MRALAILICLLTPCLQAQNLRKVNCRCIALDLGVAPPEMRNSDGKGFETKLQVSPRTLSRPVACVTKDGTLRFGTTTGGDETVATGKIPPTATDLILVFFPVDPKAEAPRWKFIPIEDTPESFPPAGAHVVNLHLSPIRLLLGEHAAVMKPASHRGFARPDKRDDFNMAQVAFQFDMGEDKWVTSSETMLRFAPGLRYLLLAYVDPRFKRPRVSTVKVTKAARPRTENTPP